MPIIINGKSGRAGAWWTKHLQNAAQNERVQIIEYAGLSAETIRDAFREMEGLAAGTRAKNYFYQANINPRADEQLTPQQWQEAVDRLESNLGLTGQPRFVVEHEKNGRTHRHVIWSRIDAERGVAISDSLTAAVHERTSRQLEAEFDLERGQSILVPDREAERRERRPKKHETLRAAESGIDPKAIKADITPLWQQSDNGRSFKAALESSGYVLARGDRRDFVIIDRAGDDHSLARRLGVKAAELRARMADLDPASLPSVQEAKAQQRDQQKQPEAEHRPEPGSIKMEAANQNAQEPMTLEVIENEPWQAVYRAIPQDADRTLLAAVALCADQCAKFTFAAVRVSEVIEPELTSYYRDRQADADERRDEARKMLEALPPDQVTTVSPLLQPDVVQSRAMFGLGEMVRDRPLVPGEEPRGPVTAEAIDRNPWQAVTRGLAEDADLSLVDRVIGASHQVFIEAREHSRRDDQTREEGALWDILATNAKVRLSEAIHQRADLVAAAEQRREEQWAAGQAAYDALPHRYDELRKAEAAEAARHPKAGEVQPLFAAAAEQVTEPAWEPLDLGEPVSDEVLRSMQESAGLEARASDNTGLRSAGHVVSRVLGGLAKTVENMLGGLLDFFVGGPKLTLQQLRDQEKAETNLETLHARAYAAEEQQKSADQDELIWQQNKQQQEADQSFAALYGAPPTVQERNTGKGRSDDWELERDR